MTPGEFVQACLDNTQFFYDHTNLGDIYNGDPNDAGKDICFKRCMAILLQAKLPGNEDVIGRLGAGTLEDLMSHWLLDRLIPYLPFDEVLHYALGNIYMQYAEPSVQERYTIMKNVTKRLSARKLKQIQNTKIK